MRERSGHEISKEQWLLVIDIDLNGAFYFTKAVVAYWLTQEPRLVRDDTAYGLGKVTQRGALVNIASVNSHLASRNMSAYGPSRPLAPTLISGPLTLSWFSGVQAWRAGTFQELCVRKRKRRNPVSTHSNTFVFWLVIR